MTCLQRTLAACFMVPSAAVLLPIALAAETIDSARSAHVRDGGFEAGQNASIWTEYSTNFAHVICADDTVAGGYCGSSFAEARAGRFLAWLGGSMSYELGAVEQNVVIPAATTSAELRFWFRFAQQSGNGTDFFRVLIDGTELFQVNDGDPGYSAYEPVVLDVVAFADDSTHLLRFEGESLGGPVASSFFVDGVSIMTDIGQLLDGGFEIVGPLGLVWDEASVHSATPICDEGCTGAGAPREGESWAWFRGHAAGETSSIAQTAWIPAGNEAILRFWLEQPELGGNGVDSLRAVVDGATIVTVLDGAAGFEDYARVDVDVTPYADSARHHVEFAYQSFGGTISSFSVDDIQTLVRTGVIWDESFEYGSTAGDGFWDEHSLNYSTLMCPNPYFGCEGSPSSGDGWVWFCGQDIRETGWVEQTAVFPPPGLSVRFDLMLGLSSGNGQDYLAVAVDGVEVHRVDEGTPGFAAYAPVEVDLSSWADGNPHTLRFQSECFGGGVTSIFLDDSDIIEFLFRDGFEDGGLGAWSTTVP